MQNSSNQNILQGPSRQLKESQNILHQPYQVDPSFFYACHGVDWQLVNWEDRQRWIHLPLWWSRERAHATSSLQTTRKLEPTLNAMNIFCSLFSVHLLPSKLKGLIIRAEYFMNMVLYLYHINLLFEMVKFDHQFGLVELILCG